MAIKNERALSRELMHRLSVKGIFAWSVEKGHGGTDGAPDLNVQLKGICAIMPTELKLGAIRNRALVIDKVQPSQVDFHIAASKAGVHTRLAVFVPVTNELIITRGISILNWHHGIPEQYWLGSGYMSNISGDMFRDLLSLGL